MKKIRKKVLAVFTIVFIFVMIVALAIFLMKGSETLITTEDKYETISVLDCNAMSPTVDPLFISSTASNADHHVKLEFRGKSFDKASYIYTGKYQSNEEAEDALSLLHADYNIYMGSTGIYQEDLYPTFSTIGSENVINLFIPKKFLNTSTARLIFLDSEELDDLNNSTIEHMQETYEKKNFSCKVINNSK